MFNIIAQLHKEIEEFNEAKILIAGKEEAVGFLNKKQGSYSYNQKDVLDTIEMYFNSKFKSGEYDQEGQKKVFLNICKFRSDVATKQVDLDLKDFVFVPETGKSEWGAYFLSKKFRDWAKESYFSELINEVSVDYAKYGTAVVEIVKKELVRIPVRNIINCQDATSLKESEFVILPIDEMTYTQMEQMKGWNIDGIKLEWDEEPKLYRRYGFVPLDWYKEQKGLAYELGDEMRSINTMAILMPELDDKDKKRGNILFIEEVRAEDRPFEEVHWSRQDGRWLGIGEIENQFDNQVMQNLVANMRRRALLWSTKKIFQSSDDTVAKNLVKDVRDGDVLEIMPNGQITQVNTVTQNLGEFTSTEQLWEKNSDQKSFTYEVATGEALPSGTPFRLGVILSNATNSHFQLKREKLGLFWKRVVKELIYPVFKKENNNEHTLTLFADEAGVNALKETLIEMYSTEEIYNQMLSGVYPDVATIKQEISNKIMSRTKEYVKIPKGFYENIDAFVSLVITGEEVDLPKKIESLTNLFNVLSQRQDPRAERVLSRIMALTGENFDVLAGSLPPQQGGQLPQQEQSQLAQMTQQANQNATPSANI